jgi:hypothetical protein
MRVKFQWRRPFPNKYCATSIGVISRHTPHLTIDLNAYSLIAFVDAKDLSGQIRRKCSCARRLDLLKSAVVRLGRATVQQGV